MTSPQVMVASARIVGWGMNENCLFPLLFLRSLSILSCCPIINVHSCLQDMNLSWTGPMAYHPHTGFHYSKPMCLMTVATLANISGMGWCGVFFGGSGTSRCCATCSQYPLASESFSRRIRKSSWNYSMLCVIIPLCQVLQNIASGLVALFIREYSTVIRNITSVPCV